MLAFWRGPLLTLCLLALLAGLVGLAFGARAGLTALCFALLLLVLHHVRHLARLTSWLQHADPTAVPEGWGRWGDLYALLYRLVRSQRQRQASLGERLKRFRQAGAAMPDGVVIMARDDRIEWCNPAAQRHFGLDLAHDAGQQITYLVRQPEFVAYLHGENYREPLKLRGVRGGEQVLSVQLVPYGDDQKLLLSRDITRWERIETMRRDFIANVSHELRTPLTVVAGFLETLADLDQPDPRVLKRSLALMAEQTERMRRLVEDLLVLTRLEDTQNVLREEVVDMQSLLASLAQEAQQLSRGRHQVVLLEAAAQGLLGAEDELRSAFGNLLSNAVRYTPEGGRITLTWRVDAGEGVFCVEDTGVGIAAEHIPRLTERFYRVDRSRSRETGGTGLGLAIVKHVLARHQARLEIESEPGRGSRFSAHFPVQRLVPVREAAEPART